MIDNPAIAIGLGMIISLILTESVGVTAGGLIVPGYIALNLHSPAMVLTTFGISLFTLAILNLLSRYIIINLNNLNIFYKKVMPVQGWEKYSKVSLKFNNQIVCTKK